MKSSHVIVCCWLWLPVWAACGDAVGGPAGGPGGSGGSGGGGAGSDGGPGGSGGTSNPGTCGGEKCAFGQICRHNECGAPDSEGHCQTVPLDCIKPPTTWEPVCGCDGIVRRYSCNDMDLAPAQLCKKFPCGAADCDIATEYCEYQAPADAGQASVRTCKPVPAGCVGAPTCACTRTEPCGARCMGTGMLGLVLTCPGG